MIYRTHMPSGALVLVALAVVFSGCSRKAGTDSSQDSSANPSGGEQSEAAKKASREHGRTPGEAAQTGQGDQGSAKQAEAARTHDYTLDTGSNIVVRTVTALSTKTAKAGDRFEASLEQPLVVGDRTVAPKGTTVFGQVTVSDPSGKLKGSSFIGVQLTAIAFPNSDPLAIQTATNERKSQGTGRKTAAKVGIGAGLGAVIGAIAGGGKGAAIGAGVGGAAGGGVAYATGGNPAVIPSETVLTFRFTAPLTITLRD